MTLRQVSKQRLPHAVNGILTASSVFPRGLPVNFCFREGSVVLVFFAGFWVVVFFGPPATWMTV